MSLVPCHQCSAQISSHATTCPHCDVAVPVPKQVEKPPQCAECKVPLSRRDELCPSCGYPNERETHLGEAFASLIIPGSGQYDQGRRLLGIGFFLLAAFCWTIGLGWTIHIFAAYEAYKFRDSGK